MGLASSEKQIPQIVETVGNSKHGMERMEWLNVLAKQVRWRPDLARETHKLHYQASIMTKLNALQFAFHLRPGVE